MDVKEKVNFYRALISFLSQFTKRKDRSMWLLLAVILALALACLCVGCTSNHYFSINAEEMTNPRIEYHDSTTLSNPF